MRWRICIGGEPCWRDIGGLEGEMIAIAAGMAGFGVAVIIMALWWSLHLLAGIPHPTEAQWGGVLLGCLGLSQVGWIGIIVYAECSGS
jgi:hypothetical protein